MAQRTYATARSVEFDAVLVASAVPPAADAVVSRDSKAGAASAGSDPRVLLLLDECFRHCKAIGSWDDGDSVVEESGCIGAGVVVGDDAGAAFAEVQALLGAHRVWERFAAS